MKRFVILGVITIMITMCLVSCGEKCDDSRLKSGDCPTHDTDIFYDLYITNTSVNDIVMIRYDFQCHNRQDTIAVGDTLQTCHANGVNVFTKRLFDTTLGDSVAFEIGDWREVHYYTTDEDGTWVFHPAEHNIFDTASWDIKTFATEYKFWNNHKATYSFTK